MDEPKLKLTPEESRLFGQLFKEADSDSTGFVTGEVAVNFFGRTNLPQQVLGAIWDLVDPENRGFLMQDDFAKSMRLIGCAQANPTRPLDASLALKPAPLPQFQGFNVTPAIRVPPLSPDDAAKYMRLFEQSGAVNGVIGGDVARSFFMRSGLPNEILIAVWNLADSSQRGALGATEFIVAMHLLSSYKSGSMTALPKQCPPALFEAAARMAARPPPAPAAAIPRQFSGVTGNQRVGSPANRMPGSPAMPPPNDWVVAASKPSFDEAFDKLDTQRTGLVAADQAATYFRNSGLPDNTLAQIWDLSNIRKADQLNRDEFAVAMYLIRTQRQPDRSELPQVLPASLIPPSLRSYVSQQSVVASGPPAPQSAPVQPPVQKSAAEDLFGLDELTSSPVAPVAQQSTGGSTAFGDPFGSKPPPPVASSPIATSGPRGFKPFVPTSSFGQGLTVQNTGGSAGSQPTRDLRSPPATQPSAMDDLLGDADPEVSKKLTQDTSELANMSNQIGQLRIQMQDVSAKKTASERDLSSTSTQKRDLELRLSQFRTQYEAEVKAVKDVEQQLMAVRSDTQNLQRELAMVEGTFQDLQNKHQQASMALETERRDNASLKERMTQLNQEISRLRPEIEKMRSDARHEKGMASINKKQLEKSEAERDSLTAERQTLQEQARAPAPQDTSATVRSPPVASPPGQSTNPFFRRSPQPSVDAGMAPGSFARDQPAPVPTSQFDSLWDTAFTPTGTAKGAPPASFAFSAPSAPSLSSNEPTVLTPSTSPPASSYKDSPKPVVPPEQPASRLITSGDLPIRGSGAESSVSMRVGTPSSRMEGTATPTATSVASTNPPQLERAGTAGSTGASLFDRARAASPVASVTSQASKSRFAEPSEPSRTFSPAPPGTIPGAFPGTQTSPIQSQLTGESSFTTGSNARETPFSAFSTGSSRDQAKPPTAATSDFESAFASRTPTGNLSDPLRKSTQTREPDAFGSRFPPVNSLVHEHDDDDSDSEADGFDDDFTAPSPGKPRTTAPNTLAETLRDEPSQPRTAIGASKDDLPPITAQTSPPEYVASPEGPTAKRSESTSNSFPPEFGGLLPQRELSMSPPQPAQSPSQGAALFGGAPVSKVAETTPSSTARSGDFHSAASQASAPSTGPTTHFGGSSGNPAKKSVGSFGGDDDFDAGFDDLEDARADDDKDDELFSSRHEHSFEAFDPTFDSPAASKSNTLASDFDAGFGKSSTMTLPGGMKSSTSNTTDWDSFMSSSTSKPSAETSTHGSRLFSESGASSAFASGPPPTLPEAPEPPKLNRGVSMGTEHDDPILKQLTGMGFDRQKALDSLETYDYNLDKAIEHLSKNR